MLDALTTDRPYRPRFELHTARKVIVSEKGNQFDPGVIEAFETIPNETFDRIAAEIQ